MKHNNIQLPIIKASDSVLAISKLDFINVNVVPKLWYKNITNKSGSPDLLAIVLLAEIVYWHRLMPVYENNTLVGYKQKFNGDKWTKQTADLSKEFGFSEKSVNEALNRLCELNLITRFFKDVRYGEMVYQKRQHIDIVYDNVLKISGFGINESSTPSSKKGLDGVNESSTPSSKKGLDGVNESYLYSCITNTETHVLDSEKESFSSALDSAKVAGGSFDDFSLKNFQGANEDAQVEPALDAQDSPNPQVAPAPLSPTSIEALEAIAVAYGCNGKSKAYAGEFFYSWEGKGWQVNSSGAKMKNVEKHFQKFLADKMPKEETPAHPAYKKCVELFLTRYQELHNRPHMVLDKGKSRQGIDAKGGNALKEILLKLEAEMRHKRATQFQAQGTSIVLEEITFTQEEVEQAFLYLMKGYTQENPRMKWHISNMSLPILNSKFNDVINIIQEVNGTTRNNPNNRRNEQPSTAELTRMAMQAKYGADFDRMQQR